MNIREGIKKAKIVSLLLLIPALSFADVYKPVLISDVATVEVKSENIRLRDKSVQYSISYQSGYSSLYKSHDPDHLVYLIEDSWNLLRQFMDEKNMSHEDCRQNYNINIFVLDRSIMYDTGRFSSYFNYKGRSDTILWAYYDTTAEVRANSAILLTDVDSRRNDSIFAHELAHYWWDRMCLGRQWPDNTEHFANQYERYYRERR